MSASLLGILNITATLLLSVQNNPLVSTADAERVVSSASQTIQSVMWTLRQPTNTDKVATSTWPSARAMRNADFFNEEETRIVLRDGKQQNADGSKPSGARSVSLNILEQYSSFGDLNRDNLDDAVLIVKTVSQKAGTGYHLAVMLNHNGTFFNLGNEKLINPKTIFDHRIEEGLFTIDYENTNGIRAKRSYALLGNRLLPL